MRKENETAIGIFMYLFGILPLTYGCILSLYASRGLVGVVISFILLIMVHIGSYLLWRS